MVGSKKRHTVLERSLSGEDGGERGRHRVTSRGISMDDMRLRPQPTLRWLSLSPPPPSPSPPSSAPPSPNLASLHEALHEPLIKPPPRAHLPRQPPLFSNLARSTLPTASLCSPAYPPAPPIISAHSTSTPSSLDTLRSFSTHQTRSLSTSTVTSSWWSSAFDSVPPLPPSPTLRRKCTHPSYSS